MSPQHFRVEERDLAGERVSGTMDERPELDRGWLQRSEWIGGRVKTYAYAVLLVCLGLIVGRTAFAQQLPPQQLPASVSGKWILYCKDPNRTTSAKYLDLQQKGSAITGHFKGPNQSGGVEGTINEQHLLVRTKTRVVLTFRGRVDGPRVQGVVQGTTFNGTFHDRGGTGSFQGQRSN
jgi:hypothetical protein